MANIIASELQLTEILDISLVEFKRHVLALNSFSTSFAAELQGDGTVSVPYYPQEQSESQSRVAGEDYRTKIGDTETSVRQITPNRNRIQGLSFTPEQVSREPQLNVEKHGKLKGLKLAIDVMRDIFSVVTAENFPGETLPAVDPALFDSDDIRQLAELCIDSDWAPGDMSLFLNPKLHFSAVGDSAILDKSASNSSTLNSGLLPELFGFKTHHPQKGLHANGDENLAGFAAASSGVITAFAPVPPTDGIRSKLIDYRQMKDDETGIILEYKHIADENTSIEYQFIESHYGYAVGEANAIKRIVTQAAVTQAA